MSAKRPWYWLRIMVAKRDRLSDKAARDLTPEDILLRIGVVSDYKSSPQAY